MLNLNSSTHHFLEK